MGFFKNLFKKKPGGSFVGNFTRMLGFNPTVPTPAPLTSSAVGAGAAAGANAAVTGRSYPSIQDTSKGGKLTLKEYAMKWQTWAVIAAVAFVLWDLSKPKRKRKLF